MPLTQVTFDEKDVKKLLRPDTKMSRFWRRLRRITVSAVWFIFLTAVIFYGLNSSAFLERLNYKSRSVDAPPTVTAQEPVINYEPEIYIAKINLSAPVHYETPYPDIMENLKTGVVQYQGTALPGQRGNVAILGHSSDFPWSNGSFKTVFASLDKLEIGDEIVLPYKTKRFVYKVSDKMVVKPTTLSVLNKTSTPTLTLITCYPVGTALNRLIIRAELSEDQVTGEQTTEPFLGGSLPKQR